MSEYLKFANRTAGKALGATLAAVAFVAVAGLGVAHASSFSTLDTTTLSPSPLLPGEFTTVDTALANDGSLGEGFDIQIGAFVGDISEARYAGLFDFDGNGIDDTSGNFAAFRFWNPTEAQGGSIDTLAGAQARIHEIYFESDLQKVLADAPVVYASDSTSFEGGTLRPSKPPGIDPIWGGTFAGLDRGRNKGGDDVDDYHDKIFSGVGEGQWFEVYFATTLDSTKAITDILGDGTIPGRIAMHIGDCDIKDSEYTYDSSDGSYHTSDGSRDHEYGKDHSDKKEYDDSGHETRSGSSCVVDTWPPGDDVTAIPLPAAFPLYGTGLAVMGFIGWRKRRKAQAAA